MIPGDSSERCFLCGRGGALQIHHCLHGASRKRCDADGLTAHLCLHCHTLLHDHGIGDRELQQVAERVWLKQNSATVEDFIKRYGKNYL